MGPGTRCFPYKSVKLQTYESRTLFLMTSLQYSCILGLAEIKTLHLRDKNILQKVQDGQVTKLLDIMFVNIYQSIFLRKYYR